MTINEKLTASKNGLEALLSYANGVTGESDTNIGDAIRTLADGYGQGGKRFIAWDFTPEADIVGSYQVTHNFGADSYAIFVWSANEESYGNRFTIYAFGGIYGTAIPTTIKNGETSTITYNSFISYRGGTAGTSAVNVVGNYLQSATNQNYCKFNFGNGLKLLAGVTYHAIVIEL